MNILAKVRTSLVIAACSTFIMSCAKELPELPVYAAPTPASIPAVSQLPTLPPSNATLSKALAFVADDLVAGLSFIPGLSPQRVTLASARTDSEFDALVKKSMIRRGFSINQRVSRASNGQLATSYLKEYRNSGGFDITGIISIDSVLIKRTYFIEDSTVTANTSYSVRGINPQLVTASDLVRVL